MKALNTGGAGCIGSDLAAALLARGQQVTVLDNLSSGKIEHVTLLRDSPGFHFVEGDLLDSDYLKAVIPASGNRIPRLGSTERETLTALRRDSGSARAAGESPALPWPPRAG